VALVITYKTYDKGEQTELSHTIFAFHGPLNPKEAHKCVAAVNGTTD